ncbi:MAG: tetratricopeptide repeat protein [Phycisphaerales bacterium]|nr:tetratricopeptide repeat protein [Phycisphaerales bacterium]
MLWHGITTAGQQESLLKAAEDALAQSNWEAAIRHFEKALQITPNNEAAGKLAKARLNLKADQARSLIDGGNLPQARTLLMEVLRADEAHPIAAAQVDRLSKLQDYQTALQRGDAFAQGKPVRGCGAGIPQSTRHQGHAGGHGTAR